MPEEPTLPADPGGSRRPADDRPTEDIASGPSSNTRRYLELRDIPARIGPYRVIRELGHGGMGAVLLAIRDGEEMQKHVAIKLVKRGMDTREILKRFELERKVIGSLSHPNIARVIDAGATDDGRPYFVMEYIQGQPIDEYCDSQQLTTRERLVLFTKVCAAVQYAHQNLIVHRDIKPGNVLVTPEGEPMLVDFGIAKMLNPDLAGFTLDTLPEARVMTPEYASPEQVKGEPISTASDIYSLGVLLYELLTGRRPYQLKSRAQAEIIRVVCEEEPERPSTAVTHAAEITTSDGTTKTITAEEIGRRREMAPTKLKRSLAGDIDNIVLMAMRKSPRRRYQSAEQFAQDIANHLHDRPVIAAPETWHYNLSKFVARNKVGVAAAALIVLTLTVGLAGTTWQYIRAERARLETQSALDRAQAAERAANAKYEQMRDFAGKFFGSVETGIQRTEGATASRKILVDTARTVLENFRSEGIDDPTLLRMLADMNDRMALVVGGGRTANEGSLQDAALFFRKSIEMRRALLKAAPDDMDVTLELADSMELLAFVLTRSSASQEADLLLEEANALAKRAVAAPGTSGAKARRIWSKMLIARADRMLQSGKPAEAEPIYREALSMIRALVDATPEGTYMRSDLQRELGVAHSKLAGCMDQQGNEEAALEGYQRSLTIREALFAATPTNATNRRDVVVMSEKVAKKLMELGRDDQAEAVLQRAMTAVADYMDNDPDDKRFPADAARLIELAGDLATKRGDARAAADLYLKYTDRLRAVYGDEPESTQTRFYLARGRFKHGEAMFSLGSRAEGAERMRSAVAMFSDLADRNPDNAILRLEHARAARRLGEVMQELGRAGEAGDAFSASVASYQIAGQPGKPALAAADRSGLAESLAALSDIAAAQNDPQRAIDYAKRARDAAPAEPSPRVRHAIELAAQAPEPR